jgi:hypothetical protein
MKKYIVSLFIISIGLTLAGCFDEQDFSFPDEFSYVAFGDTDLAAVEGTDNSVDINVIYSGSPLSSPLSVPVSIVPSGETDAVEGVDYSISGGLGNVTIPAGEASATITVNLIDNETPVGPRFLVFSMGSPQGVDVGKYGTDEGTTATLLIGEDDLTVFGYTSFEEPLAGEVNNYPAQGGVEQVNVPGENSVDYVSVGGEMGFNSSYVPGQEGGEDSGLLFGVTKFTSDPDWEYDVGSFPDGDQAYSTSDADGLMEIVFDQLDIPANTSLLVVNVQLYFVGDSWEDDDEFDFFWRTDDGDELILSLRADGNGAMTDSPDGSGSPIIDQWTQFVSTVNNVGPGSLVIQIGTDSGSEVNFIDAISIRGI